MGLLDGDIANIVNDALGSAGMFKPAVLIKVTEGTSTPGQVSGSGNQTFASFAARGIEASLAQLKLEGTLITGVDAAIRLFGASIANGQVPAPGDRITIGGVTYTIVVEGVSRDAAAASYVCQCRK